MLQKLSQMTTQKNSKECLCPKCQDTGWEMYYKNGLRYARECSCGIRQKEIQKNKLRFASIPPTFADSTLDNFDIYAYKGSESQNKVKIALKCINYWLNDFNAFKGQGNGLYIYSNTKGSGKTRMTVSIAHELMKKGEQVKFCTSLQIINEIKTSWERSNEQTESKLLDQLSTADILIIDDFGAEKSDKAWINERFYQIVNNRYVDKKITIYTSNNRPDYLDYDDRIINRIQERSFLIPFPEESVRLNIAKENMAEMVAGIKEG